MGQQSQVLVGLRALGERDEELEVVVLGEDHRLRDPQAAVQVEHDGLLGRRLVLVVVAQRRRVLAHRQAVVPLADLLAPARGRGRAAPGP